MQLIYWGVRGSVPAPDRHAWRYGGNTPCLEIRSGNELIILDAGTGIRELGRHLSALHPKGGVRASLLLTHYHWDQIQGLPFFAPLYTGGNKIQIFGPVPQSDDPKNITEAFQVLFSAPFFPVEYDQLKSSCTLRDMQEHDDFRIGQTRIRTCPVNHPQGSLAFRLDDGTASVVYATDHEPGKPEFDDRLLQFALGADVLISDAQYCPDEMKAGKAGWGHGSWEDSVGMALRAKVGSLFLYHHEPWRSDQDLDHILGMARKRFPSTYAATEGMVVDADRRGVRVSCRNPGLGQRVTMDIPVRIETGADNGKQSEARLQDLSFYGAYFLTPQSYEPEQQVRIMVPMGAKRDQGLQLTGYVLRVEPQADDVSGWVGVAVQFEPPRS